MVSQYAEVVTIFIGTLMFLALIGWGIIGVFGITYDYNNCIGTWKNVDFSDQDTCMIFYENRSGNFIIKDVSYPFTWKPAFGRSYDIYFINGYKTDITINIYIIHSSTHYPMVHMLNFIKANQRKTNETNFN